MFQKQPDDSQKKAGNFPAFFHKHLLIFEKYFGQ
jgi:hypothetical protein